jgi:hypothetical protein
MKRTYRKPSLVKSSYTLQAATAQPMSGGRVNGLTQTIE